MSNNRTPSLDEWFWLGEMIAPKKLGYKDSDDPDHVEKKRHEFFSDITSSFMPYLETYKSFTQQVIKKNEKRKHRAEKADKEFSDLLAWSFLKISQTKTSGFAKNEDALYLELTFQVFLQAVTDGNLEKVKELLDLDLQLLLSEPPNDLVITSTLTKRKFNAKNVLVLACKLNQIKMVELLLSYYKKLEQTDTITNIINTGLSSWTLYKKEKNSHGKDQIIIPENYIKTAKTLIGLSTHAASHERLINTTKDVNIKKQSEIALCEIEYNINLLFEERLPDKACKLDEFDVNLFFLALTRIFRDKLDLKLNDDDKFRQLVYKYCTPQINFIQSAFDPETATVFCTGLHKVITGIENKEEIPLNQNTIEFKLEYGESFYSNIHHSDRRPKPGFAYGIFGQRINSQNIGGFGVKTYDLFESLCLAKEQQFLKIKDAYTIHVAQEVTEEITLSSPIGMCSLF